MIRSHHLHLQWKFKLLSGKFTEGNKAKHCTVMSTNFLFSKVCWQCPASFAFIPQANFPTHNLNFLWRWWDLFQATLKSFLLYNVWWFRPIRSIDAPIGIILIKYIWCQGNYLVNFYPYLWCQSIIDRFQSYLPNIRFDPK